MAISIEPASTKKFKLNNGLEMPAVGLGTYRIRHGDVVMKIVDYALNAGYRMFDTAAVYGNEVHLKEAFHTLLPKYGLEREDIFITTKLSPADHGGEVSKTAFMKSLDNLGLDYIDLYLIHFPGTAKIPVEDLTNVKMRDLTWAALVDIYDEGRVNAIGVSNFTVKHLTKLMSHNHGVVPAVNQVEWHPYYYQKDLLKFCRKNEIILQAYCSLGGSSTDNFTLLQDPVVSKIAAKLEVTNAQVLLAWALQQDIAIIPKSTNPEHIKQNISLNFKISQEDMKALDELGKRNIKYAWDPTMVV